MDTKSVTLDCMFPELVDEWLVDVFGVEHSITYTIAENGYHHTFTGPADQIDALVTDYNAD